MSLRDLEICVAVVARPGRTLDACLGALDGAGVPDPLVVRVRDWRGGLSDARNRALARCDGDVLALVEDDVAVGPAWLDAVHHAFSGGAAASLRGCAGGPLLPRFTVRPSWLHDDLLAAFPLLRLDGEARDVAPVEHTFPAGNVAFRAAALRGVGGFWPARGHPTARDWFGEDHFAQHELADAGWSARFAPAMTAERLIDEHLRRRDVLGARLRSGARYTLTGGTRTRADAVRTAASGLAGAPVALLRGDPAKAAARAARAAENAGVLLGPLVAHEDLQPVAPRTPFRDTVPPAQRATVPGTVALRRRRATVPGTVALVLLYHRVADVDEDPLGLAVAPRHFAQQLDVLGDRVVPLADVVAGHAPQGAVAITFDDGYVDNLTHAAPALAGRPATLYVTTNATTEQRPFWWDVVGASHPTRVGDRAWPPGSPTARRHLHAFLQAKDPKAIAELTRDLDGDPGDARAMTRDELREAAQHFELGAHTRTHRSLAWTDAGTQREELVGSADDLARWTGQQPQTCSYPFGVPGTDVDATTRRVAREAGFTAGLLNHPGLVTARTDRFAIPRLAVPDLDGTAFAAWLGEIAPH